MSKVRRKAPLLILVAVAISLFTVGAILVNYWQSGPIGHQVEIYGADAKAFDLVDTTMTDYKAGYESLTPITILTDRLDVRGLAFGLALDPGSKFPEGKDLNLKISATGPTGMTGVANIHYAVYYDYAGEGGDNIALYGDSTAYSVCDIGGFREAAAKAPYVTIDVNIDELDDYSMIIPAAEINRLDHEWTADMEGGAPPSIENCGGIWIFLEFDTTMTSPVWPPTPAPITITVEFGTA